MKVDLEHVSKRQQARIRTYENAWVRMPAKTDRTCAACDGPIPLGERVQFHVNERVAKHLVCPPTGVTAPAPPTFEERFAARADERAKRVEQRLTADRLNTRSGPS